MSLSHAISICFQNSSSHDAALVFVSVTSLRGELAGQLEPRASQPQRRLAAIGALAAAGIPVGVLVAPVIPGLTDHEMPGILAACRNAGATTAGYVPLRLPFGLAPLFEEWLTLHAPLQKDKILNRVREIRGGRMNDPNFGSRLRGEGEYAKQLKMLFRGYLPQAGVECFASHAERRRIPPSGFSDDFVWVNSTARPVRPPPVRIFPVSIFPVIHMPPFLPSRRGR